MLLCVCFCAFAALIGLAVRTDEVSNRQILTVGIGIETFNNVVRKGVLTG